MVCFLFMVYHTMEIVKWDDYKMKNVKMRIDVFVEVLRFQNKHINGQSGKPYLYLDDDILLRKQKLKS